MIKDRAPATYLSNASIIPPEAREKHLFPHFLDRNDTDDAGSHGGSFQCAFGGDIFEVLGRT